MNQGCAMNRLDYLMNQLMSVIDPNCPYVLALLKYIFRFATMKPWGY